MALIKCIECDREISDKAAACPGCGCPVEFKIPEVDYSQFSVEDLWFKAHNAQYKGNKADFPIAEEIYNYIIEHHSKSEECIYARQQLAKLINRLSHADQMLSIHKSDSIGINYDEYGAKQLLNIAYVCRCDVKNGTPEALRIYKYLIEKYPNSKEASKARERIEKMHKDSLDIPNKKPIYHDSLGLNNGIHEIPTHGGLATLAFIMGFGVLGGIALGSHIKTKKLIANGDYDAALQASSTTFMSSMLIIVGMPILAVIIIFGIPH